MTGHLLHLACLLAICLPLLSVQLPRLMPLSKHARSKLCAETRSTRTPTCVQQRSQPQKQNQLRRRQETRSSSGFGADGTTGEDIGTEQGGTAGSTHQRQQEEQGPLKTARKPWDPPFPRKDVGSERRGPWLVLPQVELRKSGRENEGVSLGERVVPSSLDGDVEVHEPGEAELRARETTSAADPQHRPQEEPGSKGMTVLWLIVAGLAVLLLLMAFGIFIAHSLAWFLVSNTEARLGEARRGLLKGGEMRLCLCST